MTDFKLKGYTITSEKAYNVLKKYDNLSGKTLKKLDTNGDTKIDENELIELVEESDSTSSKSSDSEDSDEKTDGGDEETDATKSTMQQIDYYTQQINQLNDKILNLSNELIGEDDPETVSSVVNQLSEYQAQVDSNCKQIYSLLVKKEEIEKSKNEANQSTAGADSAADIGLAAAAAGGANKGTSYSADGTIAKSSSGSANYALQYDGKGASEMSSIMRGAGCNFHGGAWCADFVTFATKMANNGKTPHNFAETCPNTAYCPAIGQWARDNNLYTTDVSKVQPGDFILYGSAGSERHIGIVTAVNSDGSVDTIEGNTSDDNGNYTDGVVNQHHHVKSFGGFVIMH